MFITQNAKNIFMKKYTQSSDGFKPHNLPSNLPSKFPSPLGEG